MSCKNRKDGKGAKRQEVQSQGRYRQIFEGRGRTRHRARTSDRPAHRLPLRRQSSSRLRPAHALSQGLHRVHGLGRPQLARRRMGYEAGQPAIFDRNINGWVRIPKEMKLPDNQQDRDMLARASGALPDLAQPSAGFAEQGLPKVLSLRGIGRGPDQVSADFQSGLKPSTSTSSGNEGLNARLCQSVTSLSASPASVSNTAQGRR